MGWLEPWQKDAERRALASYELVVHSHASFIRGMAMIESSFSQSTS